MNTNSQADAVSKKMSSPIEEAVHAMLRIRWVVMLGALLPGAACYFVVGYTYLLQFHRVANFSEKPCKDIKNVFFPPVSYSIGVWEPQRFIWLIVMFIHLPPRLFFLVLYQRLFMNSAPKSVWYRSALHIYKRTLWLEPFGLIVLSVVDINIIHALGFTIWIICFNLNVLINILLHHFCGFKDVHDNVRITWWVKVTMFVVSFVASISTPVTYSLFSWYCNSLAYNLFSLSELVVIGCNSFFYCITYWEFPKTRITLGIKSVPRNLNSIVDSCKRKTPVFSVEA